MLDILNNREKAALIWLLVFIAWVCFQKSVRRSLFSLVGALFKRQILVILLAMSAYVALIIAFLSRIHLWDSLMLKDTLLWVMGTGLILLLSINKAGEDETYFRKLILDSVRWTIILEFIANLYTFSLPVELILVPAATIVVGLDAFAALKPEYAQVKTLTGALLAISGLAFLGYAAVQVVGNYETAASAGNVRALLLPPLLTLAYLPFIYVLALYIVYEGLFVMLKIWLKDNRELARFARLQILKTCSVSLEKARRFSQAHKKDLIGLRKRDDVLQVVERFREEENASQAA